MGTLLVGAECYDLVATVGKGTFGEVAQGRRRSTGEMVAIKILKKKRYHGRVVKNELKLLQALRGVDTEESHIVRFLESFADGACTYLVFELLEQNLRDFQKKNNFLPLPVRRIRTVTVQLLAALLKLKELSITHVAWKTCSCFQRVPHPTGSWQLRPPGEEMAKPVERRRYVFSSLDQLAAVHIPLASDSGQEALAEHCDLRGMVALLKTMLTWDSQERITPSAALEHPFISLQQVKSSFEATQYYQLCHTDLRASRTDASAVQLFPGTEGGAFIPASQRSIQEATTQTDGLSLAQPSGYGSGTSPQDVCQAPIPTRHGTRRYQHQRHPGTKRAAGNSIVLGAPGSREQRGRHDGSVVVGSVVEQNLPGRANTSSHAKEAPVTRCDPKPPSAIPVPKDGLQGTDWDSPTRPGTLLPAQSQEHSHHC
ncbi:unnamed protein product [Bubo scandiacus]